MSKPPKPPLDHPDVGICTLPEGQWDALKLRARRTQRSDRPRRQWVKGDGDGDPNRPEGWLQFGVDSFPENFDADEPFDAGGVNGFPVCVYLDDQVLAFLLVQGVPGSLLAGAYPGDINHDSSIETSTRKRRRNCGSRAIDESGSQLVYDMSRDGQAPKRYVFRGEDEDEGEEGEDMDETVFRKRRYPNSRGGLLLAKQQEVKMRSQRRTITSESKRASVEAAGSDSSEGEELESSAPTTYTGRLKHTFQRWKGTALNRVAPSTTARQASWMPHWSLKLVRHLLLLSCLVLALMAVLTLGQSDVCDLPGASWLDESCSLPEVNEMDLILDIPNNCSQVLHDTKDLKSITEGLFSVDFDLTWLRSLLKELSDEGIYARVNLLRLSQDAVNLRERAHHTAIQTDALLEHLRFWINAVEHETESLHLDLWWVEKLPGEMRLDSAYAAYPILRRFGPSGKSVKKGREIWAAYFAGIAHHNNKASKEAAAALGLLSSLQTDLGMNVKGIINVLEQSYRWWIWGDSLSIRVARLKRQIGTLDEFDASLHPALATIGQIRDGLDGITREATSRRSMLSKPWFPVSNLELQREKVEEALGQLKERATLYRQQIHPWSKGWEDKSAKSALPYTPEAEITEQVATRGE